MNPVPKVRAGFLMRLAMLFFVANAACAGTIQRTEDPKTGWLTSMRCAEDTHHVEFLRSGKSLGEVMLRVRTPGAAWRKVADADPGVKVDSRFFPCGDGLRWEIVVKNTGNHEPLEIGDLALPLPMNADSILTDRPEDRSLP